MIRHRPVGSGNPYETSEDQRVPVLPLAGELVEIRATSQPGARELHVELADGSRASMDHLGEGARGRLRWSAAVRAPDAGGWLRYRIVGADGSRTRWWSVAPAAWVAGGSWQVERERSVARLRAMPAGSSSDVELHPRLASASLGWLRAADGVHRARVRLALEPGERLIGFGERYDRLDQRGNRLDVRVFEPYKRQWEGPRTYLPMPFFISSGGWGAWLETSRRAWFDLGASDAGSIGIDVDVDPADPSLSMVIVEGTPQDVLRAFLEAQGGASLPPDWVFQPWMSGNEWNTQARVMSEVRRGQELGIPAGVLVIEAWSDETSFAIFRDAEYAVRPDGSAHQLADFSFPAGGAWPDPKGMVDELHAAGLRLLLWQVPLMKRRRELEGQAVYDWQRMVDSGYAVRRADGTPYRNRGWWFPDALLLDFTGMEARDWWLAKRRYLVEELGIDGFKTDGGEHAWGDELRYADGRTGADVNNEYAVHYQAAYHELLRAHRPDGLTFSRSGFVGSARYPAFWAGDEDSTWEAFRAAIICGQQAGVSGIFFWGWDIGGFSGELPSAELYLRATAMATFCPIMQYHSEYNAHRQPSRDRTPWNVAEQSGDPSVIELYRFFASLRERLVSYLVEESRHAVSAALPLMRPLAFDDPSDETAWQHPLQYRLGRDLIVAPVSQPGRASWPVYVPPGQWADLWSGERIDGPDTVERAAPLSEIPVLVRRRTMPALRRALRLD